MKKASLFLRATMLVSAGVAGMFGSWPASAQEEWTRFRGPNGSGQSEATTVPDRWTEKDYNWRVAIPGEGHSSAVIWDERIFLASAEERGLRRLALCLSAADGSILWKKEFSSVTHPLHLQNSFASSTPTVDRDHVYFAFATQEKYVVRAFDHQGRQVWETDLGQFVSQHGFGASPIVHDDMVIINNDQDGESSLVALDRATGNLRWRVPRRTAVVAYSTPCVYQPAGGPAQLIFNSQAHGISSIDPRTGRTNWELEVFDKRSVSSPVVIGDLIFGSCGSGQGGNYVVALRPGAQPKIAYKIDRAAPYVPTSVARADLLFLWGDNSIVTCVNAPTGETLWHERVGGNFSGSPVRVADRIYCISAEGEVVVLAASTQFELIGRYPLGEGSRSTPAVAGGRIYFRTVSHLISLGGAKKIPTTAQ